MQGNTRYSIEYELEGASEEMIDAYSPSNKIKNVEMNNLDGDYSSRSGVKISKNEPSFVKKISLMHCEFNKLIRKLLNKLSIHQNENSIGCLLNILNRYLNIQMRDRFLISFSYSLIILNWLIGLTSMNTTREISERVGK